MKVALGITDYLAIFWQGRTEAAPICDKYLWLLSEHVTPDETFPSTPICKALRYTIHFEQVIRSFRHKGLKRFYVTGSHAGIQPSHTARLARQLARLNSASSPEDMSLPGWKLHALRGDLAEKWAVSVSGNWRLIFEFRHGHAFGVDYDDYH